MQCSQVREMTFDYALGELRAAQQLCVDVHAAHCPACTRELEDACELVSVCERALSHPSPVDDFAGLMRRIETRGAPTRELPAMARWAWRRLAARGLAAAAVALLAAITVPAARELQHLAKGPAAINAMDHAAAGGPIIRRVIAIDYWNQPTPLGEPWAATDSLLR